jgi:hypothetical protein
MCFGLQKYRIRRLPENTANCHSLGRRLASLLGEFLNHTHTKQRLRAHVS